MKAPLLFCSASHAINIHKIFKVVLAKVFDQDLFNMPKVQLGLESSRKGAVTLSNYQESKVRWLHHLLDQWVLGDPVELSR